MKPLFNLVLVLCLMMGMNMRLVYLILFVLMQM